MITIDLIFIENKKGEKDFNQGIQIIKNSEVKILAKPILKLIRH